MPYCPECGSEYRKGTTDCADCGVDLLEEERDELFADDEENDSEELDDELLEDDEGELLEIYSGPPYAANAVLSALKDRSIKGVIQPESETLLVLPTEVSVYVTESDYAEYEDLIQECLELVEIEEDHGDMFDQDEELSSY